MNKIQEKLYELLNVADEMEESGLEESAKRIRENVDNILKDISCIKDEFKKTIEKIKKGEK